MAVDLEADIALVGAGPVGACAALAFARNGLRVVVIEARDPGTGHEPGAEFDLRVLAISPHSRAILDRLGAWQYLDSSRVCEYQQMHIWHQHGEASVSFDAVELARGDLGAIVEHSQLQRALFVACRAQPGLEWLMPDRVARLDENRESGVTLTLESGIRLRAGLLVAADGRDSPTRALAAIEAQAGSYRQTAIVANVDTERPHADTARQRFLATGPLAFLPLANGQSSIVWSCDDELGARMLAADDAEFRAALGRAFEFRLGEITGASQRRGLALGWHRCERWFQQRVLLIGDAAHGVHPLAGQGANLGFSDVDLLAGLLSSPDRLRETRYLRQYERRRKSETGIATASLGSLKWLYGIEQPALCGLRDLGMRLVGATPWLKRELMQRAMRNLA